MLMCFDQIVDSKAFCTDLLLFEFRYVDQQKTVPGRHESASRDCFY